MVRMALMAATTLLHIGMGQTPSAPPMKMGLWEATMTTNISRQGAASPPRVVKVKACYTTDTYASAFGNPMGGAQSQCTMSKEVWTSKGYTADYSCPANGSMHTQMQWSDMETGQGKMHSETNMANRSLIVDTTVATHFVSADCGAVKPGTPVIVP